MILEYKRKVVYLEPIIIRSVDLFRNDYVSYYRGQIINTIVGLFCNISDDEKDIFIKEAVDYVKTYNIYTSFNQTKYIRKDNIPIQMLISKKQSTLFACNDDKIVIVAALLYARILNNRKGVGEARVER